MSMSFLALSCQSFIVEVFSLWCELKDLVKIDSAVTNSKLTCILRKLYSVEGFATAKCTSESLLWLGLRKIKFRDLALNFKFKGSCDSSPNFLKVLSITFCSISDKKHDLLDIVNKCSNLTHLVLMGIEDFDDKMLLSINKNIMSNLRKFSFSRSPAFTSESMFHIAENCANLTHLGITGCEIDCSSELFCALISQNSNLQILELESNHDDDWNIALFEQISTNCHNIQKISVYCAGLLVPVELLKIVLETCPALTQLELVNEIYFCFKTVNCESALTIYDYIGHSSYNFDLETFLSAKRKLENIVKIDFYGIIVNDIIIKAIANNVSTLQTLYVDRCVCTYSPDAMDYLLKSCKSLRSLDICTCDSLWSTDDVIDLFKNNALHYLNTLRYHGNQIKDTANGMKILTLCPILTNAWFNGIYLKLNSKSDNLEKTNA